jgi:hypothetical protein
MTPALTAAIVALIFVVVFVLVRRRQISGRLEGVDRFRKHMDALSSDARRDVIDRVRDARRGPPEED